MSESEGVVELERLSREAQRSLEAGRLDEAEALFERLGALARARGDALEIDRAFCYRASVEIELGRGDARVSELRQILMRSADDESCYRAAYNIARSYELKKEHKKAAFYARLAHDRAEQVERPEWLAASKNLRANLLLAESFFDQACAEYEEALRLAPVASPVWRAFIQDNLGYAHVVQGRQKEGFRLLYESLRVLRRHGAFKVFPCLDLCFAYLEIGRLPSAVKYGLQALATAEEAQYSEAIKNALFLLGEAANLGGDLELAGDYFARLQRRFYPEAGYLPQFLMAIDVRKIINLKA